MFPRLSPSHPALAGAVLCLMTAVPASADPAVGIGLSLVFGQGQMETGVGLRVFSTDEEDSAAATVGLDYLFGSGAFRPTIGAAYLGSGTYVGLDLGFSLNGGGINYGASGGFVNTTEPAASAPTVTFPPDEGGGEGDEEPVLETAALIEN